MRATKGQIVGWRALCLGVIMAVQLFADYSLFVCAGDKFITGSCARTFLFACSDMQHTGIIMNEPRYGADCTSLCVCVDSYSSPSNCLDLCS